MRNIRKLFSVILAALLLVSCSGNSGETISSESKETGAVSTGSGREQVPLAENDADVDSEENGAENSKEEENEPVSFFEENGLELSSADETFDIPVYYVAYDGAGNIIDSEEIEFDDGVFSYNLYDYSVSEADDKGYVYITFSSDNIEHDRVRSSYRGQWSYTTYFYRFSVFDAYTGTRLEEKAISTDGMTNFENEKEIEDDMAYTTISRNGETFDIGVYIEESVEYDGIRNEGEENGKTVFTDTSRGTINVTVYAPKDYDGLMLATFKNGYTKEVFERKRDQSTEYEELKERAENGGEAETELQEYEEMINRVMTIFESRYSYGNVFGKDDYYYVRVSDIAPKE